MDGSIHHPSDAGAIMTSKFQKALLPSVPEYFRDHQIKLTGGSEWRSALCPFHKDTKPSLRVRIENGAFCCLACGEKGGDLLAFHQKRFGLGFKDACKSLGAWSDHG
jgi:hypothetical protein